MRGLSTWLAIALLLGVYGYRAVTGVPAGIAMARGLLLAVARDYEGAVEQFDQASVGFERFDALWRAGDARIDAWERQAKRGGPFGADPQLIPGMVEDYLEGACTAPSSRRPWVGMALVYHKLEWLGRSMRTERAFEAESKGWARVGRPGRVAVGYLRKAIEAAPEWYVPRNWMTRVLWLYGLEDEARQSVRDAAVVLPIYAAQEYQLNEWLEPWILADFIEASRDMVGEVPLVDRGTQLIDLGKLELRRGGYEAAVGHLESALQAGLDSLREAEANFHLGLALMEAGRADEGRDRLRIAGEHAVFRTAALLNLAGYAERAGRWEDAVPPLRELRREDPREIEYCLRLAAAAARLGRWQAAFESLRWARLIDAEDERPLVALIELHLDRDNRSEALSVWRDLCEIPESAPACERYRLRVGSGS